STAEGDVTLSRQIQVDAEIRASSVTIAGTFKGNIVATNRTELSRGGKVDGNVTTKVLVVAEGAAFTGQSVMDGRTPTTTAGVASEPAAAASENGESNQATSAPERSRAR